MAELRLAAGGMAHYPRQLHHFITGECSTFDEIEIRLIDRSTANWTPVLFI